MRQVGVMNHLPIDSLSRYSEPGCSLDSAPCLGYSFRMALRFVGLSAPPGVVAARVSNFKMYIAPVLYIERTVSFSLSRDVVAPQVCV